MAETTARSGSVRHAWEEFLESGREPLEVRPVIAASWRRSHLSRVAPDDTEFPFVQGDTRSRLVSAADPVLNRFATSLPGTNVSIVLADRRARIVGRWVGDASLKRRLNSASIDRGFVLGEEVAGTNGIGTALEELRPVQVIGPEHYVSALHHLTCVGVPIRHPLSGRIEGVLDLACPVTESNSLLLPTVIDLAAQIERELFERVSDSDRSMLRAFLARNAETTRPVIALTDQMMMTNASAAPWLDGVDQAFLLDQADMASMSAGEVVRELSFPGGRSATARCLPVHAGMRVAGLLIELDDQAARPGRRRPHRTPMSTRDLAEAGLAGGGAAWQRLARQCARLSAATPICISGERGVGKLALARYMQRRLRPDAVCTILPAGLARVLGAEEWLRRAFAATQAPAGTLVLTHVDLLAEPVADALCDVLDLAAEAGQLVLATRAGADSHCGGRLGDRLGTQLISVPPLRERQDDIAEIVEALIRKHASSRLLPRVVPSALRMMVNHPWPGNVRELESLVVRLVGGGRMHDIAPADLPELGRGTRLGQRLGPLEVLERDAIIRALRDADDNKTRAATMLGLSRSGLYRKIRTYGIDPERPTL